MTKAELRAEKINVLVIVGEILVTIALFLGGALLGERLAEFAVPGHGLTQLTGLVMLPLSLVLGLNLWLGTAFARELWRGTRGATERAFQRPGGTALLPLCGLAVSLAAGVAACSQTQLNPGMVLCLYLAAGAAFGGLAWLLARVGCFDFWKWIGFDARDAAPTPGTPRK